MLNHPTKKEYYLIHPDGDLTIELFEAVVQDLSQRQGVIVNRSQHHPKTVNVSYNSGLADIQLSLVDWGIGWEQDMQSQSFPLKRMELSVPLTDWWSVELVKRVCQAHGFRIFSRQLMCFLPQSSQIIDISASVIEVGIDKVFRQLNLQPLFWVLDSQSYYVQPIGGSAIFFVNGFLLNHFVQTNQVEDIPEFRYRVADSPESFVRLMDVGLIPSNFYQYFNQSLKIFNEGRFAIEQIDRKVFIKPLIMRLDDRKQNFLKIANEGSSLIYMDKVRYGETLDETLKRIIRDELHVADDYIGAVVNREIEFDRDKEGILTPRLVVRIYLEQATLTEEQEKKAKQTWRTSPENRKTRFDGEPTKTSEKTKT